MSIYFLDVFKKSPSVVHEEDERYVTLRNAAHCIGTTFFHVVDLDYELNKGILKAEFENINGNFNVFIGICHKNMYSTGTDIKERDLTWCFSAYDGQKWCSEGGENYGSSWDRKGAKAGIQINFADKTLSFSVDGVN